MVTLILFFPNRIIYRMAADKVKYYFSSLMEGQTILSRTYASKKSHLLGIPLTTDILIEIVCFGYSHSDTIVC